MSGSLCVTAAPGSTMPDAMDATKAETVHSPRGAIRAPRRVHLREAVAETTQAPLLRGGVGSTPASADNTGAAASETQVDPSVPTARGSKQCPNCKGDGLAAGEVCTRCEGAGTVGEPLQRATITEANRPSLVSFHPRFAGHPRRIREAEGDAGPVYEVEIIAEGLGNKKDKVFYTKQTLREATTSGVLTGMQAYADHPGKDEEYNLPERSVKTLVGYYRNFKFKESGSEGLPCIAGELVVNQGSGVQWFVDLLESAIAAKGDGVQLCGISIDGDGLVEPGEVDGQYVNVCRQITSAPSADIVTKAARGGNIVRRLRESHARTRPPAAQGGPMQITLDDLKSKLAAANTRLRESQAKLVKDGATEDEIADALKGIRETSSEIEGLTSFELREAQTPAPVPDPAAAGEDATATKLREAETALAAETGKRVKLERNLLAAQALQEAEVPADRAKFLFPQLQQYETLDAMAAHIKGQEDYEEYLTTRIRESAGLGPATRVEGAGARIPAPAAPGASGVDALAGLGIPVKPVPAAA